MTEHYQVTLYSQMGPRQGKLTLQYDQEHVTGSLELVGHRNAVRGTRDADGKMRLSHPIQTAVSTIFCETVLEISDGRLTGETQMQPCRMRWEGRKAGEERETPAVKELKL